MCARVQGAWRARREPTRGGGGGEAAATRRAAAPARRRPPRAYDEEEEPAAHRASPLRRLPPTGRGPPLPPAADRARTASVACCQSASATDCPDEVRPPLAAIPRACARESRGILGAARRRRVLPPQPSELRAPPPPLELRLRPSPLPPRALPAAVICLLCERPLRRLDEPRTGSCGRLELRRPERRQLQAPPPPPELRLRTSSSPPLSAVASR
ncbi:Os11g0234950 [Oryza sativa Japonica Group]|uniref:Os11g0234950 protein n=1 Tax=Oryza sativa subsp. japonica TaxID=39947 RepID=A0A0N7KSN9_ORYSJ|nr:Os11g0234950 [Oryza sativa Japonica Group]